MTASTLAEAAKLTDLTGLGSFLLTQIQAGLVTIGVPVPSVVYRSPGAAIAWDSEQLTASLVAVRNGNIGDAGGVAPPGQAQTQYTEWDILLLRAVPSLEADESGQLFIPPPTDLDLAAAGNGTTTTGTMDDAAALYLVWLDLRLAYSLTDPTTPFGGGYVEAVGPNGGIAGNVLRLAVQVF